MRLFDDIARTDDKPAKYTDSLYNFLNRSAWSSAHQLRDVLETWFGAYPAADQQQLKNTFTSAVYSEHLGAWWELYVYTMYRTLGFQVEVHPEIPTTNSEKKPDFLISSEKAAFYVECTATSPRSHTGEQNLSDQAWIYDAINEVNDARFFVGLRVLKVGTQRPRVREVTRPLREWLAELDPDDDGAEIPPLILPVKDWELSFTAYPIAPEKRTDSGRLLGVLPPSGTYVFNDVDVLHDALRKKGGRYGERLDKPLIVALASTTGFTDEEDVTDAVFGPKALQYLDETSTSPQLVRLGNKGYWRPAYAGQPARGARVSGVLFGQQLNHWNIAKAFPKLWLNPWAHKALTVSEPFTVISELASGEITERPGTGSASIFGLPDSWPT